MPLDDMLSKDEGLSQSTTADDADVEDLFVSEEKEVDDIQSLVGEFDEEEVEDIHFASHDLHSVQPIPVSKEFRQFLDIRIGALVKLEALEKKRLQMLQANNLSDEVKSLYNMQNAELRHLPEEAKVKELQNKLQQRITSVREKQLSDDDNGDQQAEQVEISPDMEKAWSYGLEQYNILGERAKALTGVLEIAQHYYAQEPLAKILNEFKYPVRKLFGMSIYQLALESWLTHVQNKRKVVQQQLNELGESNKGIFGGIKKCAIEQKQHIDEELESCNVLICCLSKEIGSFQRQLIEEFWKTYEFAACLLVSDKITGKNLVSLRAFLRYGLMGHAPWFISPNVLRHILTDCVQDIKREYDPSMIANNVVYADEYIYFIVHGHYTPSIDENLELTARNSPEWSADKALRRLSFCRTRAHVLKECRTELMQKIGKLRRQQEEMSLVKEKLLKTAKDYKKRNAELAQNIQHNKVEAARFERVVLRIEEKELPDVIERANMAKERLQNSGVCISPLTLARKEAAAVHRVCRLCAKLKDPFLPFVLRDNYRMDSGAINSRLEMEQKLQYVEKCDRNIFKEVLVNSRKEGQRIHLRYHPVFLIAPACGFIGYSWNPRVGVETGKIVFPAYCPRPGLSERMLYNMLADFRWDTSKAAAGVDLLTSDTLVAAYSAVRWDYRKKKRENREKALIFNELNDRQNWRRHYELYLQSAVDSGRKLFYKNYEVYEMLIKYIGLPENTERLRR